jgi:hypothetical protein
MTALVTSSRMTASQLRGALPHTPDLLRWGGDGAWQDFAAGLDPRLSTYARQRRRTPTDRFSARSDIGKGSVRGPTGSFVAEASRHGDHFELVDLVVEDARQADPVASAGGHCRTRAHQPQPQNFPTLLP